MQKYTGICFSGNVAETYQQHRTIVTHGIRKKELTYNVRDSARHRETTHNTQLIVCTLVIFVACHTVWLQI